MSNKTGSLLSAGLSVLIGLQPTQAAFAQQNSFNHQQLVKQYQLSAETEGTAALSKAALIAAVQKKVKYVFVLYQENRSFDSYFGTFPGADGLFSKSAADTPGFTQTIINTDGTASTIQPFRIGPAQYAADTDDIDHSHPRIVKKMDIVGTTPKMDQFAVTEELKYSPTGNPSLKAKQYGELAMAYEDCDTVPLLWHYADAFVLFDHIFQEMTGPSTPGNLAIIGAQSGETQWAKHPEQGYTDTGGSAPGVPVLNDNDPFWGSPSDPTPPGEKLPVNPGDFPGYGTQLNMTFATLPLTLQGKQLATTVKADRAPETDLADLTADVPYISALGKAAIPFGWYEEGYDKEPTDTNDPSDASGMHASYITHHNGPQYFGYIANNPDMNSQLHGLDDFFGAVQKNQLLAKGGVFFVKGGYQNIFGLAPVNPLAKVKANFKGDDDHPAYSDAQISEAMVAKAINAIAASQYWKDCAIIITWDDSEGDYDHVPPPIQSTGPDGSVITNGPRVPLILISPFARTGYIAHANGSHASVPKFIEAVYGLPALALLPDELTARITGESKFGQSNLGPHDAITPDVTDLLGAFSPARLTGLAAPLPASYVTLPDYMITNLPQTIGLGCNILGITTVDRAKRIKNNIPADFNPLPGTVPGPFPY